jgi:hypothetical protein
MCLLVDPWQCPLTYEDFVNAPIPGPLLKPVYACMHGFNFCGCSGFIIIPFLCLTNLLLLLLLLVVILIYCHTFIVGKDATCRKCDQTQVDTALYCYFVLLLNDNNNSNNNRR